MTIMSYKIISESDPRAMRLQGIGVVEGTPAGQVKPNDIVMWNFGSTEFVLAIEQETQNFITVRIQHLSHDGTLKIGSRKLGKKRLICITR